MAVTVTIATPTVTISGDSLYTVSVEATAVDGETELGTRSFSSSATQTGTAARAAVAQAIADEIIKWRSNLQTVQNAAPVMAQIKTAIEALL